MPVAGGEAEAGNGAVAFAGGDPTPGQWLVAASDDGSVLLWRTAKPAKEGADVILSEHDDVVACVAAQRTHLLSGSWDCRYGLPQAFAKNTCAHHLTAPSRLKLWDVGRAHSLATLEGTSPFPSRTSSGLCTTLIRRRPVRNSTHRCRL